MTTSPVTLTNPNAAPITPTEAAIAKVAELIAAEATDEKLALRIAVKPGGCSGFNYDMFFDSEIAADDVTRDFGAVSIVVDAESAPYLWLRQLLQLSPRDRFGHLSPQWRRGRGPGRYLPPGCSS